MNQCEHNRREYSLEYGDNFYCSVCRTLVPCEPEPSEYAKGYAAGDAAGYARAKAEMVNKLTEFRPTYVEGGRVPEDAIEHRNQPRRNDG